MEAPESSCPALSARDQPAPAPGPPGPPAGQASPHLTLSPVILPPEQGLPSAVLLKALPIPLYHTVPPGGLQPRAPLVTGSLDGGGVPFILSPLLQPEGPGPAQAGKPAAPTLTVNIVGALPVLSPGLGPTLGSPGKARSAGRHLCPHCGRDCLKPSVLEKHIRSHTGERPFPCATCHIAFKTQSNLYKHRRTQTHLNNSRLSLESEGGGSSLLEDGDRVGEPSPADGSGESRNQGASETPLSPDAPLSLVAQNQGGKMEVAPCPRSTPAHTEASLDSTQMVSPGPLLASTQPRRKLPADLKSCSLPRQQEAASEKPWDPKAPEGRLRKCESTDSGYLSRSDSAEQPPLPSSPLRSLSEHSAESEGEGGLGPGPRSARAEPGAPGELEKRRLEERIARLISHNQAVVDDPQLDHVRPRKTVLSKQGSIDLPTPYTYKDSFHFDIRAREPGRRRAALSPAHSTLTPLDRLRPLFFHSVPTQLSTTVECVPLTRSNSLPFVEGSRTWPEPRALKDACPRTQKALSPRPTPARLGCHSGLTLADVPSGHPRALVRQAAVEDLPCALAGDTSVPTEDLGEKRTVTADGASGKGRVPSKKCGQRKLKMFSQEKWQVYGHETFRRLYQKVRTSHQGGHKAREVRTSHGKDLALPSQEEAEGGKSTAPCQDSRTPVLGDISVEAKPGSWGSLPAPKGSLETEPLKQTKTEARTGDSDPSRPARAASSPTLSSRESPQSESRNPLLPPNEGLDTGWQLPPASGPLQGADPGVPSLALPAPQVGGGMPGGGGMKETGPWAQVVLRRPSGGSGEPWPAEDKHPSERKKLKVDERDPQEQPGALGAETPGDPVKASSLPCQKQDGDPGEMPGGSAQQDSKALESSDASPTAPAAAPSWAGLGDKEPIPLAADGDRGQHSQLAAPPQAPGVLAALAEGAFPPKYLLRVPQGKTPSALLATQRPPQGQDSLCTTRWPEERASLVGPGLGTPWSLSPVSGPTSGGADGILEHPSWSRPRDGGQEAHEGSEKGDGTDSRVPAARECPGSTAGPPWELTSFPTTPTCATMAQVAGGEVHAIRHLCTGSTLAGARTSEGVLDLRTPSGELGGPPKEAPEGLPSEPPAVRDPCCSWQPSSFLRALIRPQGMSLGQPEQALSLHLGTPRSCGAQSPFPSLRAEPRLTWCCLSRSLPLPVEQEKASSVYQAPRCLGGSLQDARPNVLPVSNGGRTRRSPGGGELVQTPQLSHPMVPGRRSQDQPSDPEWKKGLFRRRVKTSRGNSKQRRLKINPKRYEGTFWQSRTPLRTSRLRKPLWVPRSCPRLRLEGPEPHGTHRNSGLNLQGDSSCATSGLSLGCGNEEEKEGDCGRISEISSPSSSSRTTRERDKSTAKDISPSAGQDGGCSQQHDAAAVPGLPLQVDTCVAVAKDDPTPQGKGLEAGLPEAQLPPSQGQVAGDPKPCVSSDAQEPPSFGSKGTFPHHDIATSVAAICISVGALVGHTMLGIHSAEPQEHSWAAGEALAQSSPAGRAKLTSGQKTVGSAPRGSTGEVHLETPAPGLSSTRPHKEEGGHQAVFPSRGHYGCGEMAIPCPKAGSDSEKCQVSELITWKGCVVSSNPGQPSEVPEAPSRSVRKRSLEGMRKQTRVELSDSSSDDEDRLVIEI